MSVGKMWQCMRLLIRRLLVAEVKCLCAPVDEASLGGICGDFGCSGDCIDGSLWFERNTFTILARVIRTVSWKLDSNGHNVQCHTMEA